MEWQVHNNDYPPTNINKQKTGLKIDPAYSQMTFAFNCNAHGNQCK